MRCSNRLLCCGTLIAFAGSFAQGELNCGPFPADPDPCIFEARVTMPIERTLLCLDALNLTATDMQKQKENNIGYLQRLLDGVYSFADLQENTTDVPDAALDDRYKEAPFSWAPYNYSVPWRQTLSELLNDTTNLNLYDYTAQIVQMMKKFQDAHTQIEILDNVFPFSTLYPYLIMSRTGNETGEQEIYFIEDINSELYNNKSQECGWSGYEVVPVSLLGETIATINGLSAKEYFKEYATLNGNYKSPGARFNSLLIYGLGRNTLFTPDFRQNYNATIMNVEFANGATAVIKPLTLAERRTKGVEDILLRGTEPRTDFNKAVVAYYEGRSLNTTEPSDGRGNFTVPDNVPGSPLNPNPEQNQTERIPFNDEPERPRDERRRQVNDMMAGYAEQKAKRKQTNPTIYDLDIEEIHQKLWRNRRQGPLGPPDVEPSEVDSSTAMDVASDSGVDVSGTEDLSEAISETGAALESDLGESSESEVDSGVESETGVVSETGSEEASDDSATDDSAAESATDGVDESEAGSETGTDDVNETESVGDSTDSEAASGTEEANESEAESDGFPFGPDFNFTVPTLELPEPEPNTPSEHVVFLNNAGAIYNYSGVPVLRYPAFFKGNDPSQFIVDTINLMDRLLEDFATIREGNERLVIDVSGNGGGLTILPNLMVDYLARATKDTRQCPIVDIREGPIVNSWVNLTQFPPPETLRVDDEEIEEFIQDLEATTVFLDHVAPDELDEIQDRVIEAGSPNIINQILYTRILRDPTLLRELSPRDRAIYVNTFRNVLAGIIAFPEPFWGGISPIFVGALIMDAYNESNAELEHTSPTDFWYTNQNNFTRGGIENSYSMKIIECLYELLILTPKVIPKGFTDIVLLTDGTCGSACGQFLNAMQALGGGAYDDLQPFTSTVVGFGGFIDEPLSMNAFEGGNVLSDEDFLFDLYVNGALLGPLYTGIGQDKEVLAEQYREILMGLPIPYNNGFMTRFNYRETYTHGAGQSALPTEFYQKPVNVHLGEWHRELTAAGYGMFNEEVNDLYTRMAAGDLTTNAVPSNNPANPLPEQSDSPLSSDDVSATMAEESSEAASEVETDMATEMESNMESTMDSAMESAVVTDTESEMQTDLESDAASEMGSDVSAAASSDDSAEPSGATPSAEATDVDSASEANTEAGTGVESAVESEAASDDLEAISSFLAPFSVVESEAGTDAEASTDVGGVGSVDPTEAASEESASADGGLLSDLLDE